MATCLVYDIVYNDGSRVYVERLLGISVSALSKGTVESPRTIVRTFSEGELGIITEGSVSKNIPQLTVYQETNTKSCVQTEFDETTHIKVTANPEVLAPLSSNSTLDAIQYYKHHTAKFEYSSGAISGGTVSTEQTRSIVSNANFQWISADLVISANNTVTAPKNYRLTPVYYNFTGLFKGYNELQKETIFTSSVTITLNYNKEKYTIRWYKNHEYGQWTSDPKNDEYKTTLVLFGTELRNCTPPASLLWIDGSNAKIGYTGNWSYRTYVDDDVLHGSDTMPDYTVNLYAMYLGPDLAGYGYKITFVADPGSLILNGNKYPSLYYYEFGPVSNMWHTKINPALTVDRLWYDFIDWDGHPAPWSTTILSYETYHATWKRKEASLRWYASEGSWPGGIKTLPQSQPLTVYWGDYINTYTPTPEKAAEGNKIWLFDCWQLDGARVDGLEGRRNFPILIERYNYEFHALYKIKTYILTWILNGKDADSAAYWDPTPGDEANRTTIVNSGTPYPLIEPMAPGTAKRTGYTHKGWFTAATGGTRLLNATTTTLAGPINVYSQWNIIVLTVTWNLNGTSTDSTAYWYNNPYDTGTKPTYNNYFTKYKNLTLPGTPVRTGYTSAGWWDSPSGGNNLSGNETKLTTNITVYHHWDIIKINVTYNPNGGSWTTTVNNTKSFDYFTRYNTIANNPPGSVTREGYNGLGWFTAASGGTTLSGNTTKLTTAITVYQQWKIIELKVTYDVNGGKWTSTLTNPRTFNYFTSYDTISGYYRNNVAKDTTYSDHKYYYYSFAGWYTDASGGTALSGNSTLLKNNMTVYAHWNETWEWESFTVTWDPNGGTWSTGGSSNKYTYPDYGDYIYSSNAPASVSRTNYDFDGWYYGSTQLGSVIVTSDITITAHWVSSKKTICYDVNGGSWKDGDINKCYDFGLNAEYNSILFMFIANEMNSPAGKIFDGWYDSPSGGSYISGLTKVTEYPGLWVYAHWVIPDEPEPTYYTVTWDPNGGTVPLTSSSVLENTAYKDINRPTPSRTDYDFDGWFTEATGGTNISTSSTKLTGNVTFYAHWTYNPIPGPEPTYYTVTWDPNGGTLTNSSESTSRVEEGTEYSSIYTLYRPKSGISYTGYIFVGWFTSKTGGTDISDSSTTLTSNVTFYAHWSTPPSPDTYTVYYDVDTNGGTWDDGTVTDIELTFNSGARFDSQSPSKTPLKAPTVSETFTADYWFTTSNGTTKKSGSDKVTSNFTVYAKFTRSPREYTVTYDVNGGNSISPNTKKFKYGTLYSKIASDAPATPTRTGYTFDYWMDSNNNDITSSSTKLTGSLTVKAHWTAEYTYEAVFLVQA